MNPTNPVTRDYEIYLPAKDKFVTTGDAIFCEHVGRRELERLLPPLLSLPESAAIIDAKDYQNLVDTIHLDNDEGVQYRVLKVYNRRGVAVVDRVLYNPDIPDDAGGTIDTVFLDNVVGYPIILGGTNPGYQPIQSTHNNEEVINLSNMNKVARNSEEQREIDIRPSAPEILVPRLYSQAKRKTRLTSTLREVNVRNLRL